MKQTRSIGRDLKVSLDIEKLLSIREELKKKYVARVGVLGQKTNRIPMLTGESHERYKARILKLRKLVKQGYGSFEVKDNEDLTNAEIGLTHEMGSMARHIPRRSFLEMPLSLKMPAYAKTFGAALVKALDEGDIRPAFINLGIKGEQVVQLAFASRGFGNWPGNAPSTIARKGSSSPLIDTAQLRRSITSDVVTK